MNYALISPTEQRNNYYRVAEVANTPFDVSVPLYWLECDDSVTTNNYYDPVTNSFVTLAIPIPTAEENKSQAIKYLKQTDWVNEPDVYNVANTPHLLNRDEFLDYRIRIRQIAVYPVKGNIQWPVKPTEQWSS